MPRVWYHLGLLNFLGVTVNFTMLHEDCGRPLGVFLINNKADMEKTLAQLRRSKCRCGSVAEKLVVAVIKEDMEEAIEDGGTWDKPPMARHSTSYLRSMKDGDVSITEEKVEKLGGRSTEYIRRRANQVLELCPNDVKQGLSLIPVRSLETYEPNAVCMKFRRSSVPAIMLHEGLLDFFDGMNRSIIPQFDFAGLESSLNSEASADLVSASLDSSVLGKQAIQTALHFLGKSPQVDTTEIGETYETICGWLTLRMVNFLIAHEYAHVVLDHHASTARNRFGGKSYFYRCSRRMETAADEWAQDVCSRAEPNRNIMRALSSCAPLIAFLYFDFLSVIRLQVTGRDEYSDSVDRSNSIPARSSASRQTHPSDRTRARKLLEYTMQHESWQEANMISVVDSSLDDLIDRSAPILRELGFRVRRRADRREAEALIGSADESEAYSEAMASIYSDELADQRDQENFDEAQRAIDGGEISTATSRLERIVATAESEYRKIQALFSLAYMNHQNGLSDSSIRAINRAIEYDRTENHERIFQAFAALAVQIANDLPRRRLEDRIRLYRLGATCENDMLRGLAHSKLGAILGMAGRELEAKIELEKAYEIGDPISKAEAAGNLAAALVASTDRTTNSRAVELALESIAGKASDSEFAASVRISLGIAYANLGKRAKARETLLLAAEAESTNTRVRAARELRKLR